MHKDNLPDSKTLLNHILELVEQYRNQSANHIELTSLRSARQQVAQLWLATPQEMLESSYTGSLGKAHQTLLQSGLREEALTGLERQFLEREVLPHMGYGLDRSLSINCLLVVILYLYPHQVREDWEINADVPDWLIKDYLNFILSFPFYFRANGESQQYFRFMQNTLNRLHGWVFGDPEVRPKQEIIFLLAHQINAIQVYFNLENPRDIQSKRGDITEFYLRSQGAQIDYAFTDSTSTHQKIRIGFLLKACNPSPEIFLLLPILEHLDRNQFEIILYVFNIAEHQLESYCQSIVDKFVRVANLSLDLQAEIIRKDDLDILLVGANITSSTHLITMLANYRLARIQITNFASPITTGIRNIDYYFAGLLTEPMADAHMHYREKLITLDGTGFCFSYSNEPYTAQYQINREKLQIPQDSVVFASTANLFKLVPELRETWVKVLKAVPNSILMLMPFGPNWMTRYPGFAFANDLQTIFRKYGVESDRLRIVKSFPNRAEVKEALKVSDVYLDSYPYAGTTSLIDALEVGIPTIVWDGSTLRSRMGAAILKSLSMYDLIADSEESYIELAVALATNPALRLQKKQEILHQMQQTPSFLDGRAYTTQLQSIFVSLYKAWQTSSSPSV